MPLAPDDLPLYILAGGRSSRFGSDKALALYHRRPLLTSVIESLAPAARCVAVVADRTGKYDHLDVTTIADRRAAQGPIGGLEAAMRHRTTNLGPGWLLLAACDLVDPQPRWVDALWRSTTDTVSAVAYQGESWEPLLALYHTRLLPTVSYHIHHGLRSMQNLLDRVSTVGHPLPDEMQRLPQANTPESLASHDHASGGCL